MEFIKDYSYNNLKRKFILLYILNVIDIVFTLFLLETGLFLEANIIMSSIVSSPIISVLLKVVAIGLMLAILYKRMAKANDRQLKIGSWIFNISIFIYVLINISHLLWVALYLKNIIS